MLFSTNIAFCNKNLDVDTLVALLKLLKSHFFCVVVSTEMSKLNADKLKVVMKGVPIVG
jgi:hypothetical protein